MTSRKRDEFEGRILKCVSRQKQFSLWKSKLYLHHGFQRSLSIETGRPDPKWCSPDRGRAGELFFLDAMRPAARCFLFLSRGAGLLLTPHFSR